MNRTNVLYVELHCVCRFPKILMSCTQAKVVACRPGPALPGRC